MYTHKCIHTYILANIHKSEVNTHQSRIHLSTFGTNLSVNSCREALKDRGAIIYRGLLDMKLSPTTQIVKHCMSYPSKVFIFFWGPQIQITSHSG